MRSRTPFVPAVSAVSAMVLATLLSLGCRAIDGTAAPETLGYGPPGAQASGYEPDPLPRPAPTPWTPPAPRANVFALPGGVPGGVPGVPHSPEVIQLCAHLEQLRGATDPDCLAQLRVARVFRSQERWRDFADCTHAAASTEAAETCRQQHPFNLAPIPEQPRESAVCMHLFALTTVEELGESPQMSEEEIGQFAPLLGECVDSLVEEREAGRDPDEYAAMLRCVETSTSSAAAERCE